MKKETTYKQVILFSRVAKSYIEKNIDADTKIIASIKSVQKQIRKDEILENYDEQLRDLFLTHCSVNEKGNIIKEDNGDLIFTPEKQKLVNKESKELLSKTVTIHTRILTENDAVDLIDLEKEVFSGLVITELTD